MIEQLDPLASFAPGSPERVQSAIDLAESHFKASASSATEADKAQFRKLLNGSAETMRLGENAVIDTVETIPVVSDRLSITVDQRARHSQPGAHLEQDALAAEIRIKTNEQFHL